MRAVGSHPLSFKETTCSFVRIEHFRLDHRQAGPAHRIRSALEQSMTCGGTPRLRHRIQHVEPAGIARVTPVFGRAEQRHTHDRAIRFRDVYPGARGSAFNQHFGLMSIGLERATAERTVDEKPVMCRCPRLPDNPSDLIGVGCCPWPDSDIGELVHLGASQGPCFENTDAKSCLSIECRFEAVHIRSTYLGAATTARNLIARPEVAERWDQPSALRKMTVGDVAAHLGRAVITVDGYLDAPASASTGERLDAVGYYLSFADDIGHDVDTELNEAVRLRAGQAAAEGHSTVLATVDTALGRLASYLETTPSEMVISVLGGLTIGLDDYLVTRLVELTVHVDDLAVSIDVDTPAINERALRIAIASLVDMARRQHGDIAVLRALARRERDQGGVIPVL